MSFDRDIEHVLVLGIGKVTGPAVATALLEAGVQVKVSEAVASPEMVAVAERLRRAGADVWLGEPEPGLLDWADLIVPAPGVPPTNPLLRAAVKRGLRVWSEIELASRFNTAPLIAVTGTNGKTTTTTLLTSILETGGFPAVASGNIGVPLIETVSAVPAGWVVVCETSSFQLHFIDRFRPSIAIVLNVGDDHYDWHSGYDDYLAAKARITENQVSSDLLIVKADDPGCIRIAAASKARLCCFATDDPEQARPRFQHAVGRDCETVAGIRDGKVVISSDVRTTQLVAARDIRLQGPHNLENVLAAVAAAAAYGVDAGPIAHAVSRFEPLPHRVTVVAEKDGVVYVDDSKATNPQATLRALDGFERVILIAGGRAKGLDLAPLAHAAPKLNGLVVMGEAADELASMFPELAAVKAPDVEAAVAAARSMAQPGDTVLLSPACSSVDQYSSYVERGERFAKAVLSL